MDIQHQNRDDQKNIDNSLENLILDCNKVAMEHLKNENFQQAIDLLKKAEKLLIHEYQSAPNESIFRLIGITLNNLGCYYKRISKPKVALMYLKKALQVEIFTLNEKSSIAGTHLNICAILSSLKDHEQALKHAKLALEILEVGRNNLLSGVKDISELESTKNEQYKSLTTTMIIAYYNMGTEFEFLKQYNIAIQAFTRGYQLGLKELGNDHPLTQNLYRNMMSLFDINHRIEDETNKKNEYALKKTEQNKGIRYHSEKRNMLILDDEPESKTKHLDYGYDGHRKIIYKSNIKNRRDIRSAIVDQRLPKLNNKFGITDTSRNKLPLFQLLLFWSHNFNTSFKSTNNNTVILPNDRIDEVDENSMTSPDKNLPKLIGTIDKINKNLKGNVIINNSQAIEKQQQINNNNGIKDTYNNIHESINEQIKNSNMDMLMNMSINMNNNKLNQNQNDLYMKYLSSNDVIDDISSSKTKENSKLPNDRKNKQGQNDGYNNKQDYTNSNRSSSLNRNLPGRTSSRTPSIYGNSPHGNIVIDQYMEKQILNKSLTNSNSNTQENLNQNIYIGPQGGADDKEPIYT